jgi:hypothetical protein
VLVTHRGVLSVVLGGLHGSVACVWVVHGWLEKSCTVLSSNGEKNTVQNGRLGVMNLFRH